MPEGAFESFKVLCEKSMNFIYKENIFREDKLIKEQNNIILITNIKTNIKLIFYSLHSEYKSYRHTYNCL